MFLSIYTYFIYLSIYLSIYSCCYLSICQCLLFRSIYLSDRHEIKSRSHRKENETLASLCLFVFIVPFIRWRYSWLLSKCTKMAPLLMICIVVEWLDVNCLFWISRDTAEISSWRAGSNSSYGSQISYIDHTGFSLYLINLISAPVTTTNITLIINSSSNRNRRRKVLIF